MRRFISVLVASMMTTSAFAWSGAVPPAGGRTIADDPFDLTMEYFGLPEDDFEDDETQKEFERASFLMEHKPAEYWIVYAKQFAEYLQNGNMPPRDSVGVLIATAAAMSAGPEAHRMSEASYNARMAHLGALISTNIRLNHMEPQEVQEFIKTEACTGSLGSWWCETLLKEGFVWDTKDRVNYLYSLPDKAMDALSRL